MTVGTEQKQHAKIVSLQITQDALDSGRTIEQFIQDINKALEAANVKRVTTMGSHYILDGKVCLPEDYDPKTLDRKPGTHVPSWAGGPSEQQKRDWKRQDEDRVRMEADSKEDDKRAKARAAERAQRIETSGATPVAQSKFDALDTPPPAKRNRRTKAVTAEETADVTAGVEAITAALTKESA